MSGKIIIINGASSSGKSSTAKELQSILPDCYHISIDEFVRNSPDNFYGDSAGQDLDHLGCHYDFSPDKKIVYDMTITPKGYFWMESFHSSISAFCNEKINIIYDAFICDNKLLECAKRQFSKHEVYFIGLFCSEEERKRREINRAERMVNMFNLKVDYIDKVCQYDFKVDTSLKTQTEIAAEIAKKLDRITPVVFNEIFDS